MARNILNILNILKNIEYLVADTRDSHAALHTIAWRPYTEAEVNFKTIVGIFEVSSK